MQKILFLFIAMLAAVGASAQRSYTFKVEELSKPQALLPTTNYQDILTGLIRTDRQKLGIYSADNNSMPYNIVAKSNIPQAMVTNGYHSFFQGMFWAYADHRPFTLSPDMVWLLIAQGFSAHVNANAEALRPMFVDFDGKTSLVVQNDKIDLNDPNSPWAEVFPAFSKQIAEHTGKELTNAMTADFSTTTDITRIASQITLMDAMKSYFDFIVMYVGCGIPEVTLEGTPEDWDRVLKKTLALRKYHLDWWVDELQPILKQFVNASQKKVDRDFWKAMFKYHTVKQYGAPTVIDGWIVKFYPYDKDGRRLNLKALPGFNNLPNEMVKVDVQYIKLDGTGRSETTPLELWAGFVGLDQNDKTFGLKPTIGWMVRKKDQDTALMAKLKKDAEEFGINLRVSNVPPELYKIGPIPKLSLTFIKKIDIPDELAKVPITRLILSGEIDQPGVDRILKLFPNTQVSIKKDGLWKDY